MRLLAQPATQALRGLGWTIARASDQNSIFSQLRSGGLIEAALPQDRIPDLESWSKPHSLADTFGSESRF